jgi:hypothetical protein
MGIANWKPRHFKPRIIHARHLLKRIALVHRNIGKTKRDLHEIYAETYKEYIKKSVEHKEEKSASARTYLQFYHAKEKELASIKKALFLINDLDRAMSMVSQDVREIHRILTELDTRYYVVEQKYEGKTSKIKEALTEQLKYYKDRVEKPNLKKNYKKLKQDLRELERFTKEAKNKEVRDRIKKFFRVTRWDRNRIKADMYKITHHVWGFIFKPL